MPRGTRRAPSSGPPWPLILFVLLVIAAGIYVYGGCSLGGAR